MRKNWVEQEDKSISISCDGFDAEYGKVQHLLQSFGTIMEKKAFDQSMRAALRAMRKESANVARQTYTARKAKLFEHIDVDYRSQSLELTGAFGMNLFHFRPNPETPKIRPRGGVTSQVKRKGRRYAHCDKDYPEASRPFVMKKKRGGGGEGGYGIFVRERDSHDRAGYGPTRFQGRTHWKKFHMLFGPSPIQALLRKDRQEDVIATGTASFRQRLLLEIDKMLAESVR